MQKSNVPSHVHDSGIVTDGRTFDIAGPEGLLLRGRGFFLKPKCLWEIGKNNNIVIPVDPRGRISQRPHWNTAKT